MKANLIKLICGLALLCAAAVRGQSALDGFDPKANGTIRAVVVQPDGRIMIGGDFNQSSGANSVVTNALGGTVRFYRLRWP